MHCYEISPNENVPSRYAADLAEVRQQARLMAAGSRQFARITLVDVPSDKAAVLELLNGRKPAKKVLRRWRLSSRGALIEMSDTEE